MRLRFLLAASVWIFLICLTWITDKPVWIEQWPLKKENLDNAIKLVAKQLQKGHIQPSTSPWNTPIFVIKKKSGKYRLLHDLRAVNAQMQPMGALQPGLPNPATIPENSHLLIVDLKDCFFTMKIHPKDTPRFAFTVPATSKGAPAARYERTVLPRGMKNSPTCCQLFVDAALEPIHKAWSHMVIYHYMDNILIAQSRPFATDQELYLERTLQGKGLVIAPEKVQREPPWKYLGWVITQLHVRPQKLMLHMDIQTLNDAQKLLGDLQWLRPIVGLSNNDLNSLRPLLKGTDPAARVSVSPEQRQTIEHLAQTVVERSVDRRDPSLPIDITMLLG